VTAEQEILSAYGENPNAIYSINEISRRIGKAYPYVHKNVHALIARGVLKRYEVGRSHLCSLDLKNTHAILLLALNHAHKYDALPEHVKQRAQALVMYQEDIDVLLYHEIRDELIIVTKNPLSHIPTITPKQLKQQLLEDETLYAHHTIIAGYEYFYSILATTEITRRYHPLL